MKHEGIKSTADRVVRCPKCDSTEVEMYALFGFKLMTSKYRCNTCSLYFEAVRWKSKAEDKS